MIYEELAVQWLLQLHWCGWVCNFYLVKSLSINAQKNIKKHVIFIFLEPVGNHDADRDYLSLHFIFFDRIYIFCFAHVSILDGINIIRN